MKTFTTEEIRDLYNRFYREEISFPRMVEIMNERVDETNEPPYKDGDFVVNEDGSILIFREEVGDSIYDHAFLSRDLMLITNPVAQSFYGIKGYATEEEKKKILDELAKEGKRWNEEKKCVEDIPKRKFKSGDKVRIKEGISSKTHDNVGPAFVKEMDDLIGKIMTVDSSYTYGDYYVECEEIEYAFLEEWLEPYEELKKGDEDMPKQKFKVGNEVTLKSRRKDSNGIVYLADFDAYFGKKITVQGYTDTGYVYFSDCPYILEEKWLEPYEGLEKGDIAIFWDLDNGSAFIGEYNCFLKDVKYPHRDNRSDVWVNAIKFESIEQYKKLLKGEI